VSDLLVLCYHAVSTGWRSDLAITPDQLESQLTALIRRGYRGARFAEAVTGGRSGKTLVVTFDDAYCSVFDVAFPILTRLGLPGTVFVPTAFAGGTATWGGMERYDDSQDGELTIMSWDQLGALHAQGWEIGSHTDSHFRLTEIDDDRLADELSRSRQECADRLGVPCLALAYPYGDTDIRVMTAAASAGYVAAAGMPALRLHAPMPMNWPRVGIYSSDRRWRFGLKTSNAVRWLRTIGGSPSWAPSVGPAPSPPIATPPSTSGTPRVAVIIPCFNDGRLAGEAVDSIQETEPVEIVVVDDASNDPETLEVLEALRQSGFMVVRHDVNQGLAAARMTGLHATAAPYVFPLDADDLAVPGALAGLADCLDANPDVAACFGDYAEFGTFNRVRRVPRRLDPYRIAYCNEYPVSSLFRRTVLESVGGWQAFGPEMGYEDWNLWMTLAEQGAEGIHWGRGVAVRRRLHGSRMLTKAAKHHIKLYATLRALHPRLFSERRRHRRHSDLGPVGRLLYPLVFGARPPLSIRSRVRRLADPLLRR
jgi:glycosyltransferase involved in cell wall biosynthesis/peptidoglycan/xylan/chitin deacetylase (PgdA/CDA1 family)